jgi:hypothetical protein
MHGAFIFNHNETGNAITSYKLSIVSQAKVVFENLKTSQGNFSHKFATL